MLSLIICSDNCIAGRMENDVEFSDIQVARLVLGYLRHEHCPDAYQTFLSTSIHLKKIFSHVKRKKYAIATRVLGMTLTDFLNEYAKIYNLVNSRLDSSEYYASKRCGQHSNILYDRIKFLLNETCKSSQHTLGADNAEFESSSFKNLPENTIGLESCESISEDSTCTEMPAASCTISKVEDMHNVSELIARSFIENETLHEKIAESINKARLEANQSPINDISANETIDEIEAMATRELDNVIEKAVAMTVDDPMYNKFLSDYIGLPQPETASGRLESSKIGCSMSSRSVQTDEHSFTSKRIKDQSTYAETAVLSESQTVTLHQEPDFSSKQTSSVRPQESCHPQRGMTNTSTPSVSKLNSIPVVISNSGIVVLPTHIITPVSSSSYAFTTHPIGNLNNIIPNTSIVQSTVQASCNARPCPPSTSLPSAIVQNPAIANCNAYPTSQSSTAPIIELQQIDNTTLTDDNILQMPMMIINNDCNGPSSSAQHRETAAATIASRSITKNMHGQKTFCREIRTISNEHHSEQEAKVIVEYLNAQPTANNKSDIITVSDDKLGSHNKEPVADPSTNEIKSVHQNYTFNTTYKEHLTNDECKIIKRTTKASNTNLESNEVQLVLCPRNPEVVDDENSIPQYTVVINPVSSDFSELPTKTHVRNLSLQSSYPTCDEKCNRKFVSNDRIAPNNNDKNKHVMNSKKRNDIWDGDLRVMTHSDLPNRMSLNKNTRISSNTAKHKMTHASREVSPNAQKRKLIEDAKMVERILTTPTRSFENTSLINTSSLEHAQNFSPLNVSTPKIRSDGVSCFTSSVEKAITDQIEGIDLMNMPTPQQLPITPGLTMQTRATDYSTSSSYYQPSDEGDHNKMDELLLQQHEQATFKHENIHQHYSSKKSESKLQGSSKTKAIATKNLNILKTGYKKEDLESSSSTSVASTSSCSSTSDSSSSLSSNTSQSKEKESDQNTVIYQEGNIGSNGMSEQPYERDTIRKTNEEYAKEAVKSKLNMRESAYGQVDIAPNNHVSIANKNFSDNSYSRKENEELKSTTKCDKNSFSKKCRKRNFHSLRNCQSNNKINNVRKKNKFDESNKVQRNFKATSATNTTMQQKTVMNKFIKRDTQIVAKRKILIDQTHLPQTRINEQPNIAPVTNTMQKNDKCIPSVDEFKTQTSKQISSASNNKCSLEITTNIQQINSTIDRNVVCEKHLSENPSCHNTERAHAPDECSTKNKENEELVFGMKIMGFPLVPNKNNLTPSKKTKTIQDDVLTAGKHSSSKPFSQCNTFPFIQAIHKPGHSSRAALSANSDISILNYDMKITKYSHETKSERIIYISLTPLNTLLDIPSTEKVNHLTPRRLSPTKDKLEYRLHRTCNNELLESTIDEYRLSYEASQEICNSRKESQSIIKNVSCSNVLRDSKVAGAESSNTQENHKRYDPNEFLSAKRRKTWVSDDDGVPFSESIAKEKSPTDILKCVDVDNFLNRIHGH